MRLAAGIAVSIVACAACAVASADIGIRAVSPREARPGSVARLTVRGYLGPKPWSAMEVVIVAAGRAPKPQPCGAGLCRPSFHRTALRHAPFTFVGLVKRWRPLAGRPDSGRAILTFRVPSVRPDRYVFGLFCERCRRGPRGSLIIDPRVVLLVRS
jgi:hypothetical protein